MAKVTPNNGPTYHLAATLETATPYGGWTIKLVSENLVNFMPWGWGSNLGSVKVTVGPCYPPYTAGNYLTSRYCVTITAGDGNPGGFTAVIVPGSLVAQQLLAGYQGTYYGTSARLHSYYPDNCSSGFALFRGQVPCQADGAIEIK